MIPDSILAANPAIAKKLTELVNHKICRFCLSETEDLFDIVEDKSERTNTNWKQILTTCFSISSLISENLSKYACGPCSEFVKKCYEFNQLRRKAEVMLLSYSFTGSWTQELDVPEWLRPAEKRQREEEMVVDSPTGKKFCCNEVRDGQAERQVFNNSKERSNGSEAFLVAATHIPSHETMVQPKQQTTLQPTIHPMVQPTVQPTVEPVVQPTIQTMVTSAVQSTTRPTVQPIVQPTMKPIVQTTVQSAILPTVNPTVQCMIQPMVQPSILSTVKRMLQPAIQPTMKPIVQPLVQPTVQAQPTSQSTVQPTTHPAVQPAVKFSVKPKAKPTVKVQPTKKSTVNPTVQPASHPTSTISSSAQTQTAQPNLGQLGAAPSNRNPTQLSIFRTLYCSYCSFRCVNPYHIKSHMRKHTKKYELRCGCDKKLREWAPFLAHLEQRHPDLRWCSLCGEQLDTDLKRSTHLKQHLQTRLEHACDFCLLIFTTRSERMEHVRQSHSDEARMKAGFRVELTVRKEETGRG